MSQIIIPWIARNNHFRIGTTVVTGEWLTNVCIAECVFFFCAISRKPHRINNEKRNALDQKSIKLIRGSFLKSKSISKAVKYFASLTHISLRIQYNLHEADTWMGKFNVINFDELEGNFIANYCRLTPHPSELISILVSATSHSNFSKSGGFFCHSVHGIFE